MIAHNIFTTALFKKHQKFGVLQFKIDNDDDKPFSRRVSHRLHTRNLLDCKREANLPYHLESKGGTLPHFLCRRSQTARLQGTLTCT